MDVQALVIDVALGPPNRDEFLDIPVLDREGHHASAASDAPLADPNRGRVVDLDERDNPMGLPVPTDLGPARSHTVPVNSHTAPALAHHGEFVRTHHDPVDR